MTRLTLWRLRAIEEALCSRLSGERDVSGDPDSPSDEDYETALSWAIEQIAKRENAE